MRPKTFVAVALILSILAVGIIIILGHSNTTLLPIYLLSFLLLFFGASIFFARDLLKGRIIASIVILTLVSLSAVLFLTNFRTYQDAVNEYGNPENSTEISAMQSEIEYYSAYADYLNQRILSYQEQSKVMEAQLEELNRLELEKAQQEAAAPIIAPIEEIAPEPEYIYYYEYEEEKND